MVTEHTGPTDTMWFCRLIPSGVELCVARRATSGKLPRYFGSASLVKQKVEITTEAKTTK